MLTQKSFVNTKLTLWLGTIYGPKLTVKRANIHDYLEMDFDWSTGGFC